MVSGKNYYTVYLDFSKVFDGDPHYKQTNGTEGAVLRWIKQWLNVRKQSLHEWGNNQSEVSLLVGFQSAQCSIHFTIYLNDLDTDLISNLSKFATSK